jgi:hypothetical protein
MPKFLEKKLKAQYGADSKIPYKIMNSIGAMHGNKETAKGAAMEKKHESDTETHSYDFRKQRGKRAPVKMKLSK